MPTQTLLVCPDEPRAPVTDSQRVYEEWNEDVRQAGAKCRLIVKANCQWYKDQGKEVNCN